jgi:hypothetical protein
VQDGILPPLSGAILCFTEEWSSNMYSATALSLSITQSTPTCD